MGIIQRGMRIERDNRNMFVYIESSDRATQLPRGSDLSDSKKYGSPTEWFEHGLNMGLNKEK
jgi:hypothetical protein